MISFINPYLQFKMPPRKLAIATCAAMGIPLHEWLNTEVFTGNMDGDLKAACVAAIDIFEKVRSLRFCF